MKRRTKLTPFAKIVIFALVFLGARYAYLHQNEILQTEFFNFSDSTVVEVDKDTLNVITENEYADEILNDTIDLLITRTDDLIRIQTSDTIVEIDQKDTLIYTVSEEKNIFGRIIFN